MKHTFGILLGYYEDTFGIILGHLWNSFGILLGYFRDILRFFWTLLG